MQKEPIEQLTTEELAEDGLPVGVEPDEEPIEPADDVTEVDPSYAVPWTR